MISFVTLFLGLVLGPQTVEVALGPEVQRVEILLDGQPVAALAAPESQAAIDFGGRLTPHALDAVAFAADGRQLGSARQWINLPRAPAEASVVLERDQNGRSFARLSWESLIQDPPREVLASFDGHPLAVADPERIELPPHDLAALHFFRAEIDFTDTVSAVAEKVFGGSYGDEITSDLTAVAVEMPVGVPAPTPASLAGLLTSDGAPVEVVAVDRGVAELVVVRDELAAASLERIQRQLARLLRTVEGIGRQGSRLASQSVELPAPRSLRSALPLPLDQHLRLLWPFALREEAATHRYALFPTTPELTTRDAGVYWLLTQLRQARAAGAAQQLSDAVAVAGMAATSRSRRRAVLLVTSHTPEDDSALTPAVVRRYLEALRVPLRVWVADPKTALMKARWGEVTDVSTAGKLDGAVQEIANLLDRQWIVWVRGAHLPQSLALAPNSLGAQLAR